jgi:hypothetical protein
VVQSGRSLRNPGCGATQPMLLTIGSIPRQLASVDLERLFERCVSL